MTVNNNAKWNEIFSAYAINAYMMPDENFTVGDSKDQKLPDIYNSDKSLGIEVAQFEKNCDFKRNSVLEKWEEFSHDFEKLKQYCDDKKLSDIFEISLYGNDLNVSNKIESYFHSVDWMYNIYKEEITKKLTKLNKGNYSGISGEVLLCANIMQRAKSDYDTKFILYVYMECMKEFTLTFDRIIVITSSKLYLLNPRLIQYVSPRIHNDCIYDFDEIPDGCLILYDFDYNHCNALTSKHFK